MLKGFEDQIREADGQDVHIQDCPIMGGDANDHEARLAELTDLLKTDKVPNDEKDSILREIKQIKLLQNTVNVAEWLLETPAAPDQIFVDTFDKGDKIAIIAPSKLKKSFFLLQMLICLAAGRDFLRWRVLKPRRVVHIQLEIQKNHFHKRVLNLTKSLNIEPCDIEDRFHVINCRGVGVEGAEGIELIGRAVERYQPEIITFDPLYKIAAGVENAIEDVKIILNAFDGLMGRTGAAVGYVHHDPKGQSGDRDIRDRGAGSNVINRDYDACITLTPHVSEPSAVVIEIMLRNYKPQEPFTVLWVEDENTGGYRFEDRPDILPQKKTSKDRKQHPAFDAYLPTSLSILGDQEIALSQFLGTFKTKTGLSDHRIRGFMAFATAGGNPYIVERIDKAAKNRKCLSAGKDFRE